jgi:deoxyadenosine/deoxycytidine kinase
LAFLRRLDLSSFGDTQKFRRKLTAECPAIIGTVPIYDAVVYYHKALKEITAKEWLVIQDRTLQEGVFVFTANNYLQGNMSDRDFETYMELYEIMVEKVKLPNLMIYLRASVPHLVENIQKRGRECEQKIPIEYLQGLNDRYDDFILNKYKGKVLVVDVDKLDYKTRPEDFQFITDKIDTVFPFSLTNSKK